MITLSRPIRTYHTAVTNGHNRPVSSHLTPTNGYHRNNNGNNMQQQRSSSTATGTSTDHQHRRPGSIRHGNYPVRQAIHRDDHHSKCKT
jgi:hypothetical protein